MKLYKQTKSIIPNSIKFPFWFMLKSPQRKLNTLSWFYDLMGIAVYCWHSIFPKTKLQPITICTGIYNRSDNYINQLLQSLLVVSHQELITLSILDCNSTDIKNLEETIRLNWRGKLIFTNTNQSFSRSKTFNQAVQQAQTDIVFLCDADMSLPPNIVSLCNNFVGKKLVWYPIYFFVYKNKPHTISISNGVWEQYGSKGMFACLKSSYIKIGGLDESYTEWGHEDTDLWERFHKNNFVVIRNRQKNFFHHWHKSFNPKYAHMNDN